MDSVSPDSSAEVRNWLELPPDVTSLIFLKLGAIDILFRAQSICSSWRKLSKEPQLWRIVDMRNLYDFNDGVEYDMDKMTREAVDRSCGQLAEFSMESFATDEILQYAADKSCSLRCLRLVSCDQVTGDGLIEVAKKLPLLEELDLSHCSFSKEVLEAVGRSCPQLKSFRLNCHWFRRPRMECDEDAFAIAENMPELRHLHLFGNKLTDDGLRAILDRCSHLESLDLRQCFSVTLGGDLQKRCADRIRILRLPNDPTDDYEFDAGSDGDGSFDEEYPSGFSEIDFLSDDEYYEFSEGSYLSDYEDFGF